jgi:hypothetical protein
MVLGVHKARTKPKKLTSVRTWETRRPRRGARTSSSLMPIKNSFGRQVPHTTRTSRCRVTALPAAHSVGASRRRADPSWRLSASPLACRHWKRLRQKRPVELSRTTSLAGLRQSARVTSRAMGRRGSRSDCAKRRRMLRSMTTGTRMGRSTFARCACSRPAAPPPLPPGRNRADWARLGQVTGEKIVFKPKRKHLKHATETIGVGESAKRQRKPAA